MNKATPSDRLTLVLGATGKTGRRVLERLRSRGVPTRAASRAGDPPFDWGERSTWDAVLDGVTAAYISYAPDLAIPGATDAIGAFVERAAEHGVRRLVLLSGRGEEEAQACERIIQRPDVEWTVVRSSWFSQNFSEGEFLDMAQTGEVSLPAGIAWLLDYLFATVLGGCNASLGDGVQRALGRAPRDFADFCTAAAASGVWNPPS